MNLRRAMFLCFLAAAVNSRAAIQTIDERTHHLGLATEPEWDIFKEIKPEGQTLRVNFESHKNSHEYTLFIRQDDVKQEWSVALNGHKLGNLFLMEADLVHCLPVPKGALQEGANELLIATKTIEDILIRGIALGDDSKERLLTGGPVEISIHDRATTQLLPARLTLVNEDESLAPIFDFGNTNLASRPGVIYTGTGEARFRVLPGKYTLYATRGPEYTMAVVHHFDPATTNRLDLTLERAADTHGWVAADTHIHTLTLSKHGDASLAERLITLAGEGIELPVSTEHNLHADYVTLSRDMGLNRYFTVVPGNEVTTTKGHFNIFPVDLSAPPPDYHLEKWPALFQQIRSQPRVRIAILNHPTDTHNGFTPFASTNLNLITGRNLRGDFNFDFDAMELINSGAMRSDWMEPFRAWFALLNRGSKVVGVGASDSHDVSRFIVGQGRTYLRLDDSDVSQIDVDRACEALKNGHATVSLGLIAQIIATDSENHVAGPGDLLSIRGDSVQFKISADFPLLPHHAVAVALYANGVSWGSPVLLYRSSSPEGSHQEVTLGLPKPAHDTFYVTIVTLDGNTAPAWGLARPYQPTSTHFEPMMIAATNPIWVDADGDGKFTAGREYAARLVEKYAASIQELLAQLASYDYYVAGHCAELLEQRGENLASPLLSSQLAKADAETQRAFRDYLLTPRL